MSRTASSRSSFLISFRSRSRRSCSRCCRRTTSAGAACGIRVSSVARSPTRTSASRTRPSERPRRLKRSPRSWMCLRRFGSPSKRKKLSDPAGRYAGVVDAGDGTVEHAGKILSQRVYLCTEQAMGRNEFKHKRLGLRCARKQTATEVPHPVYMCKQWHRFRRVW